MPREVVITGAGLISPLGDSPSALHGALLGGVPAPRCVERFATARLPSSRAFDVPGFDAETYLGGVNLRPLDRVSCLLASAAALALADSGWSAKQLREEAVGLVAGTVFSGMESICTFDLRTLSEGPNYASPMAFANTVINAAAGQTAICHNLRGVNSTVCTGATSGLVALGHAAGLIRSGRARRVLAGGVESSSFEAYSALSAAGLLGSPRPDGDESPLPFDARRNGFVFGEGAALLMLEDAESAAERGGRVLAMYCGHATGFDLTRGHSDEAAVSGTMRRALEASGVTPAEVDCVSASASGSVACDRHEARALESVFAGRGNCLGVTAVKAMLGEGLGASGGLQAVAALEAMRTQSLPGIPGLELLEERFLRGKVSPFSRAARIRTTLISSVGWDGHCCSLVLRAAGGGR